MIFRNVTPSALFNNNSIKFVGTMTQKFPFDHFLKLDNLTDSSPSSVEFTVDPVIVDTSLKSLQSPAKTNQLFSPEELKTLTEAILETIKSLVYPNQFQTYFANTFTVACINGETVEFLVSTSFIRMMIEKNHFQIVKQAVVEVLGKEYEIKLDVLNNPTASLSSNKENILHQAKETTRGTSFIIQDLEPTRDDLLKAVDSKVMDHMSDNSLTLIDPLKTFDKFVVGPSNNMAYAFSMAVSQDPGKKYPALYIYGNSGLGKTHLIHSIANYIFSTKPHLRVSMTSANKFMTEMIQAIQQQKVDQFKIKYCEKTDVLIIDDIHELKHRSGTQDQFFHIFNELTEKGKQLVFTSDKSPKDIDGIEDRIRTRLASALPVEIQQPDLETRIAILKRKAIEKDIYISDDVVNLIAKCVKSNIRELEGCLVKLGAVTSILKMDIDLELAKEHLNLSEELENQKLLTVESIAKSVANYYKIPIGDIRGKVKTKEVAVPRQVAMYLINKLIKPTLKENGQYFSNRDHSTVLHAINTIKDRIKVESILAQQVLDIEKSL